MDKSEVLEQLANEKGGLLSNNEFVSIPGSQQAMHTMEARRTQAEFISRIGTVACTCTVCLPA